jgi:hypothetical protein
MMERTAETHQFGQIGARAPAAMGAERVVGHCCGEIRGLRRRRSVWSARTQRKGSRGAAGAGGSGEEGDPEETQERKAKLVEKLVEARLEKASAERILRALRDSAVDDDAGKTRAFIARKTALALLSQLLGAGSNAFALFATTQFQQASDAISNPFLRSLSGSLLALLSALFAVELGARFINALATLAAGTVASSDTEAFIRVVREKAGDRQLQTGVTEAIDSLNVLQELQSLSSELRKELSSETSSSHQQTSSSELDALNAYFTRSSAQELSNSVDNAAYNLSKDDVLQAATAFVEFDVNENQQLDANELERVLARLTNLDKEAEKGAFRALDMDRDGRISFSEFLMCVESDSRVHL